MTWRSLAVLAVAGLFMLAWRYSATWIVETYSHAGFIVGMAILFAIGFWLERRQRP